MNHSPNVKKLKKARVENTILINDLKMMLTYDVSDVVVIYLKAVLNHYAVYELQSCRSECLINYLENECLCKPAVFPATIQFDYANYESSDMHQIFEAQNAPICTFKEHVYCAAPLILSFNYTR